MAQAHGSDGPADAQLDDSLSSVSNSQELSGSADGGHGPATSRCPAARRQSPAEQFPADGVGPVNYSLRRLRPARRCRRQQMDMMGELGDIDQPRRRPAARRHQSGSTRRGRHRPSACASCSARNRPKSLGAASAELARMLEESGLMRRTGKGKLRAHAAGDPQASGRTGRSTSSSSGSSADTLGKSSAANRPAPATSSRTSTRSPTSTATRFNLHIEKHPAQRGCPPRVAGTPVRLHRRTTSRSSAPSSSSRSSTVLMLDVSTVDGDARQLPAGQEGHDGAALADLHASTRATISASSALPSQLRSCLRLSCRRCRGTSPMAPTCSTAS